MALCSQAPRLGAQDHAAVGSFSTDAIIKFMTTDTSNSPAGAPFIVETEPSPESIRFLEERLYDFNVQATGAEGHLFGIFLRTADGLR